MRVLAHIHTYNDAAFLGNLLEGLRRQTRAVDGVVIVDNASRDDTLEKVSAENVTIIRNRENTGSCGGVQRGLAFALDQKYDWTWAFDADSVPHPEALAALLAFYDGLPAAEQQKIYYLASNMVSAPGVLQDQPMILTETGVEFVAPDSSAPAVQINFYKWSGSLFRMRAVAEIGLPSADYVIDFGELEYGHRARQRGYHAYLVTSSIVDQDVGRPPGVASRKVGVGPFSFSQQELSPIRCYYRVRNLIFFWLYHRRPIHWGWVIRSLRSGLLFPRNFLFRPVSHYRHLTACCRGFWDGLTMHMERRY